MRSVRRIIAAFLLLLSFSTIMAVPAVASPVVKTEVAISSSAEDGSGSSPCCPVSGAIHHHANCSVHQMATADETLHEFAAPAVSGELAPAPAILLTGRSPPSQLRPPIA